MAARDFSLAAALGILVLICVLGVGSGLEIPHYTEYVRMYKDPPAKRFGYPPGRFIVIDLGNTNSCVAGYGGGPGKADDAVFQFCIPSWVAFTDAGTTLVGDAAQKHAEVNPENAIFGFKRLFGLSRNNWYEGDIVQRAIDRAPYKIGLENGIHPCVEVKADDGAVKQLDLTEIASVVVAELKAKAERHLGREVWRAVVTVPQHFHGPSTRTAIAAGKLAGLVVDDGDTVSEPIAAAVAYGLHRKLREDGGALVLRVGGGTADASVVTFWDGSLEVIGHEDDSFLGGDDFDQRIVDHFVELIKTKYGREVSDDTAVLRKLRTACERAKKALSSQDRVQVRLESLFDGVDFSETLLRSEFEELNEDLFGKVIDLVERAVARAKLEKNKRRIDEIVLVGGSTMIPKIQKLVKDYFNGKEPNIRVKPDEAIALGAAVFVPTPYVLKLLSLEQQI